MTSGLGCRACTSRAQAVRKQCSGVWCGGDAGTTVNHVARGMRASFSNFILAPSRTPCTNHTTAMRPGCCTLLVLPALVQPAHPFTSVPALALSPVKRWVKLSFYV